MRGYLTFAAALALAATSVADGWLLKAPYDAKTKLMWNVTVNVNINGQDHEAKFKDVLTINSKSDKEVKGSGTWTDLTLDGNDAAGGGDPPQWEITFNPNGSIAMAGDSADYPRMLAPMTFVYPGKEIKPGDKWTEKFKPKDGKDITIDYEAADESKVGDTDVIKIKGKYSEDGPMKGDVAYWLAKDGTIVRFEADLKSWIVAIPDGPGEVDAKIKGEIAKAKS